MNLTDTLQRLHALGAEDRRWILSKLPASAKSLLLAAASGKRPQIEPAPPAVTDTPTLPRDLEALQVAAALKEEPAWLAAAVLEGAAESWVAEVVQKLPAVLRSNIAHVRRAGCTLTPSARQTLIGLMLAKIGQATPRPAQSGFQVLLERLSASRSRKRLTLHL
jgi:hypothetical protein